jgi:hypothetical protein
LALFFHLSFFGSCHFLAPAIFWQMHFLAFFFCLVFGIFLAAAIFWQLPFFGNCHVLFGIWHYFSSCHFLAAAIFWQLNVLAAASNFQFQKLRFFKNVNMSLFGRCRFLAFANFWHVMIILIFGTEI